MTEEYKDLDKAIEWYKTQDEFTNLPDAEKLINLAAFIKLAMNNGFKNKEWKN